jgi:predicted O-methyltransferase YrrM
MTFEFNNDHFTYQIPNLELCKSILGPIEHAIEIGNHEGRSACWIMENMLSPTGQLCCIDPFNSLPTKALFEQNISKAVSNMQSYKIMTDYSYVALARLISQRRQFDFIYIDGAHHNHEVITDAVMSWKLLKDGGILVFDDYFPLTDGKIPPSPKTAIDSFQGLFSKDFELLFTNTQLGVRKFVKEQGDFYASE